MATQTKSNEVIQRREIPPKLKATCQTCGYEWNLRTPMLGRCPRCNTKVGIALKAAAVPPPAKHTGRSCELNVRCDYPGLMLKNVESGLPLNALERFAEASGLTLPEIFEVVIAARTLKHRRSRKESLSRDESDKLARLMRVHDQAVRVFGETVRALWWLREPESSFEGRTPLHMTQTEFGGRLVEEALVQIDEGMFV